MCPVQSVTYVSGRSNDLAWRRPLGLPRNQRWEGYGKMQEQLIAEASGTDDELLRAITTDLWAMQEGQS